jgi:hypothetical protein
MEIKDLIAEFKNFVPKKECEHFINWFWENEDLHHNGMVYNPNDPLTNVNFDKKIAIQAYPKKEDPISDLITKIIFSGYFEYSKNYPCPNDNLCASSYSVRVYKKGVGKFDLHTDQSPGQNISRLFAMILYLNTVNEGGETEFPEIGYKCAPEQGKLLIFPCNYLFKHQGNIPLSDDKYIITSFINYCELSSQQQS